VAVFSVSLVNFERFSAPLLPPLLRDPDVRPLAGFGISCAKIRGERGEMSEGGKGRNAFDTSKILSRISTGYPEV